MSLQNALLGVLDARPMSGYELAQFFDSGSGWVWSAPQSQIYPHLRRMEADGLVVAERTVRGSKLERRVYSLTDAGRAALLAWIGEYHEPPAPRDPFALQALLFDMVMPEEAINVLKAFVVEQDRVAEQYEAHAARLRALDTPLLRERLRARPEAEHERIGRMKAHVFAGRAAVARQQAAWAREAIVLAAGPAAGEER
ncbi:PadR family transcriptional regulator [Pseudonocardia sp. TRM90224]|uniref:PadR family transcriptional regulator n=1 Tax=Pseudonocardia sp. TRM90224 TaxID=2812678 RepID=UPI001E453D1C|nr:PadR family transcriptional regulator [Pseudonocardia sp. TRM90224]